LENCNKDKTLAEQTSYPMSQKRDLGHPRLSRT
jgi:hypothetical protein